jgi:ABC-type multidrug transport system permease subunit
MNTLIVAGNQAKLLSKSPAVLALFVGAPFFLIFIWGQAFTAIFAAGGPGISAMDYFGITLLTFAVFQGASVAAWGVYKEKRANTEVRLSLAPVGRTAVFLGTFLGSWASVLVLGSAVMLACALFLRVNYGPPALALLLLGGESCLAAAVGVSIAALVGQEKGANSILSSLIPLLVFLGGGYMPIPDSGFLHVASAASPIRWVNLALLGGATGKGGTGYPEIAFLFCGALSAALLAAGCAAARRSR